MLTNAQALTAYRILLGLALLCCVLVGINWMKGSANEMTLIGTLFAPAMVLFSIWAIRQIKKES